VSQAGLRLAVVATSLRWRLLGLRTLWLVLPTVEIRYQKDVKPKIDCSHMKPFAEFLSELKAEAQYHINRTTDACNWYYGSQRVMHERTYWGVPQNLPERSKTPTYYARLASFEPRSSYWTEPVYKDKGKARAHANKYGGIVEMCFYCDEADPAWFLTFDDFEKAALHVYEYLKLNEDLEKRETPTERP
jgi:hypothetical protein